MLLAGCLAAWAAPARAQSAPTAASEPWAITDNSFLIEEAFNQERGVFQNIFTWARGQDGAWASAFTQEWPVPAMRHQLSYTLAGAGGAGDRTHFGAVLVNYRFQAVEESARGPAFSPRLSVILPTGDRGDDSDRPGLQFNLPVSKQLGDFYLHGNAGATWLHAVPSDADVISNLTSPTVGGSVIWRARQMVNVMLESAAIFADGVRGDGSHDHETIITVSPGIRGGWNFGERQLVLGAAVPLTRQGGETTAAVLGYLSYELPFTKTR
jgi:hypothetical protein